jgi:hypothetical protein
VYRSRILLDPRRQLLDPLRRIAQGMGRAVKLRRSGNRDPARGCIQLVKQSERRNQQQAIITNFTHRASNRFNPFIKLAR